MYSNFSSKLYDVLLCHPDGKQSVDVYKRQPHIQPVTHPVQSCLGLTFPVFLMINAGFLLFWLVIQRYRSALLPLLGMLLCYSQIRTYLPINFHTDHLPETSIKLLSLSLIHIFTR